MEPVVCILGAVKEEITGVLRQMAVIEKKKIGSADTWIGTWKGKRLVLVRTGVGKRRAFEALTAVLEAHVPTVVISIGYAGGCHSDLNVGDLILPDTLMDLPPGSFHSGGGEVGANELAIDPELAERVLAAAGEESASIHRGALLTVSEVITDPDKKQELHQHYGAQAVDMETAALARLAAQKAIPFLSLRAVSDAAGDTLMDVSPFMEEDGEVSKLKAGWYVITHPGSIKTFLNLKEIAKLATARLTGVLEKIIEIF